MILLFLVPLLLAGAYIASKHYTIPHLIIMCLCIILALLIIVLGIITQTEYNDFIKEFNTYYLMMDTIHFNATGTIEIIDIPKEELNTELLRYQDQRSSLGVLSFIPRDVLQIEIIK